MSSDKTAASEICDIAVKVQSSKFIDQYWNSLGSESVKSEILEFCRESFLRKINIQFGKRNKKTNGEPNENCLRVGDILKQFGFISEKEELEDQASSFFGVGLIAYCGARECFDPVSSSISDISVTKASVTQRLFYTKYTANIGYGDIYDYVIDDVDGPKLNGKFKMPYKARLPGLTFNYDLKMF